MPLPSLSLRWNSTTKNAGKSFRKTLIMVWLMTFCFIRRMHSMTSAPRSKTIGTPSIRSCKAKMESTLHCCVLWMPAKSIWALHTRTVFGFSLLPAGHPPMWWLPILKTATASIRLHCPPMPQQKRQKRTWTQRFVCSHAKRPVYLRTVTACTSSLNG